MHLQRKYDTSVVFMVFLILIRLPLNLIILFVFVLVPLLVEVVGEVAIRVITLLLFSFV